ncbi:MAG: UDP-N-acetylmuramoyl-L-alanine--D-glutamate ligase [Candidatus Kapabacteria bacterium]|jgi:UDP-N-acetylmuramoylalanine--D-glutamate ligase|nr:UDP-N-acetylmuramoyl-L-alanine--D-glutamate ligase [Candidatus Kapabacteria bacterium]
MNYTIIGAGKSGLNAAFLAQDLGHNVFLTEAKSETEAASAAKALTGRSIDAEFGGHSDKGLQADIIVTSPGVPPSNPFIQEADKRKIPIISEVEFAWRQLDTAKNPVVAITGTNGKTTTTALIAHILNHSGKKAIACGNIGTAITSVVRSVEPGTILVVETSSYQLDRIVDFRPDVALLLNITPDHLSYHGTFEQYCAAKYKISLNQNAENVLILNADNEPSKAAAAHSRAQILHFGIHPLQQGMYVSSGKLLIPRGLPDSQHKEEQLMMVDELRIPGIHNVYNSMAAALAARAFEIRNEDIRDSLMSFAGVEHRLEYVRTVNNVEYINDSKATNINSTWYALSSYSKPLVWIAGGRGDNNDYAALDDLVRSNVRCVIAIGEEADAIFNHFSSMVRCMKAGTMNDAVHRAADFAESGSVVLFSPACKSFDMFANYEHRGQVFKEAVMGL